MKSQVESVLLFLRKLRLRSLALGLGIIIVPLIALVSLNQLIAHPVEDFNAASPLTDSEPETPPDKLTTSANALTSVTAVLSPDENEPDKTEKPPTPSIDPTWQQAVQDEIRQSEYHITWQEDAPLPDETAAYQAPNREHNFRTYFIPEGIRLQPRTETTASWQWGLELTGFGYAGNIQPVKTAELLPDKNRIAYQRHNLTEWYVNGEMGLEQGFTVQRPPAPNNISTKGDNPLILELAVNGDLTPELTANRAAIDFNDANGTRVLRYSKLVAYDANGRTLPAYMQLSNCAEPDQSESCQLQLVVNDSQAIYPIVIDPIASDPDWSESGGQLDAEFGFDVAGGGDVNGDGYDDVIVSAPYYDNGQTDEGRVFVYHGSIDGLSPAADWTTESNQANAQFGIAVASASDINADGYDDILIGAPYFDNGETDEGRVFLYYGSAAGFSQQTADWTAEGDDPGARFGQDAAIAGDIDGNGYDDIIIGAPYYSAGQTDEGRVFVYTNSASGLTSSPWTAESDQRAAKFGYAVSAAGDINGDGYDDILVGSPYYNEISYHEGRVYVYYGSASGLSGAPWIAPGDQRSGEWGYAVAAAGDVNGDGYDDIVMGSPWYDAAETNDGRADLYYGSGSGLAGSPDWTVSGPHIRAYLGQAVGTAGDINNDGYDDLLVGVPRYNNIPFAEGGVFAYYGQSTGLSTTADWIAEGGQDGARMGNAVAAAGDVNGDGYDDIIVGSHLYNDEGTAFSYYGSADGFSTYADWTAEGEQQGAYFGDAVSTAGDVNGDGYDDIIIGAYKYDNGHSDEGRVYVFHGSNIGPSATADWMAEGDQAAAFFGQAVAAAGDIDGDGYDDIIIGSAFDNGQTDEGRIHVYYGSLTGIDTASLWTAESDQAGALLGDAVAGAGDVNNDGYADIIAGAPYYDNGEGDEGRVFVYHGAAGRLTPGQAADWTAESDKAGARFGNSVDTAGDVNGDGYSDLIIGAHGYGYDGGNTGRVYVYHGTSISMSATADWTTTGENGYDGWYFGNVVGDAGDVNGDGYGDIIIGDTNYDNEATDEGRVLVYYGGVNGLSDPLLPDWTVDECDQYRCRFGIAAGTAGDFNGDGYDDVIVGASYYSNTLHWEGAAFVYHGSATGLSAVSDWLVESDQGDAQLGAAVGAAGNVNGDGYDDVLVGSSFYEHGDYKEGIAAMFFGPGDDGICPTADFSASPLSGTVPLTVTFTNLSQNGISYVWQFGDGGASPQPSPVYVYSQSGVYTVTLTAYGASCLPGEMERPSYIVVTEPVSVTADFSATPLSGSAPLTVTFANASTGADSYEWQFGDGATSTETNPIHTYIQTGVYTVSLTAIGPGGSDGIIKDNYITVTSPFTRTWRQITTTVAPPVWGEYAMAYDGNRDVTVLYGGNADGWPYENDTWEFDGVDWAIITSTIQQPNAVYGADMVYDGSRIVLFGGSDATDTALAETWAFNGTNWTQLTPATSPQSRTNHTLVYDSTNGDIYLFGGNDGSVYFNDLWRFDGSSWSQVTVAGQPPTARTLHGMGYDANNDAILIFGGRNSSGVFLNDTWSFDVGTDVWTEVTAPGPGARQSLGLVYHPTLKSLILAGGVTNDGDTILSDTWHFQGGGWIDAEPIPITPGAAYHTLVYDSVDDAILLFAGGEIWEYK